VRRYRGGFSRAGCLLSDISKVASSQLDLENALVVSTRSLPTITDRSISGIRLLLAVEALY